MAPSFNDFALLNSLQQTLVEKTFFKPTEIQLKALPLLLEGRSVVGVAETGSGKTLSYALPILHLLKEQEIAGDRVIEDGTPRALILVPTRELGEQVSKVFKIFTHDTRLRVRTVLGGTKIEVAKDNVRGSFEILVATPGRLVQMFARNQVSLNDVRVLVFDEADQMLDQGFIGDAMKIAAACPHDRQMALFSATVSPAVQKLMNELFEEAAVIRTAGANRVVAKLKTENKQIKDGKRMPVLEDLLTKKTKGGTVIFSNTREQCDKLFTELKKKGFVCALYRGEMEKVERRLSLKAFREGKIDFLISTDLASRGLDVEHVGRVINYHMPKHLENYLHRVGRTARAGRTGLVINFVTERDAEIVKKLEGVRAHNS
jgi:superfamily II DNA/RNA helicase